MVSANFTCLEVRFLSEFSDNMRARISRLLRGVRSSWLMLARNSLLYLEVSASCLAFSSSAFFACSTSRFLASTSEAKNREVEQAKKAILGFHFGLLFGEQLRFLLQFFVGGLQLQLLALELFGKRLALLQELLGPHGRGDGVQHDADGLRELIQKCQVNIAEL